MRYQLIPWNAIVFQSCQLEAKLFWIGQALVLSPTRHSSMETDLTLPSWRASTIFLIHLHDSKSEAMWHDNTLGMMWGRACGGNRFPTKSSLWFPSRKHAKMYSSHPSAIPASLPICCPWAKAWSSIEMVKPRPKSPDNYYIFNIWQLTAWWFWVERKLGGWKQEFGGWKTNNKIAHSSLEHQGVKNRIVNYLIIWDLGCRPSLLPSWST